MSKQTQSAAKSADKSVAGKKSASAKLTAMLERLATIGTAIGGCDKTVSTARGEALAVVTAKLKEAMKAGLTVDDLKAPTKTYPGTFYTAIVTAMEDARGAQFDDKSKAVRDNYMSKIRNFVRDRGANPLDLYGNLAKAKAQQARGAQHKSGPVTTTKDEESDADETATQQNQGSTKNPAVKRGVEEKLIGLEPVQMFIKAWLEANPSIAGGEEKPINKVRDMLMDVQDELTDILKKK